MSKKFDVVIGNPPYQENDGGERADGSRNASASPIYPDFVNGASQISNIQSLIIPARWTTGAGKGLSQFSKDMLSNKSIKYFKYFVDAQDLFPDNLISGGVSFYVMNRDYKGETDVVVSIKGEEVKSKRYLDEHSMGVFIPFKLLSDILNKVKEIDDIDTANLQNIVSTLQPYGLRTDFLNNPGKYGLGDISVNRDSKYDIEIHGLYNRKRTSRFVPKDYSLPKGSELVDCYKVFLPYASGGDVIGSRDKVTLLGEPIMGYPNSICTETYLNIGCFESVYEAESLYKYIKSKFLRSLVAILKSTQHATRTFRLVPLQDFTEDSDIDWSKSIAEIDQQLYEKYNLNEEEINFIETNVKEMD